MPKLDTPAEGFTLAISDQTRIHYNRKGLEAGLFYGFKTCGTVIRGFQGSKGKLTGLLFKLKGLPSFGLSFNTLDVKAERAY